MIGHKKGDRLGPIRYALIFGSLKPLCRLFMLLLGCYWMDSRQVDDIDYKKWLGPDWTLAKAN